MNWQFLIFTEDYDIYGTNNEQTAKAAAEYQMVIDTVRGIVLGDPDDGAPDVEIKDWEAAVAESNADADDDADDVTGD